jgi:copper chaperone
MLIELTLPTMTCGHCAKTVTETVRKLDAQARLQIDLSTHKVQIETQRSREDVARALAEEGYDPR